MPPPALPTPEPPVRRRGGGRLPGNPVALLALLAAVTLNGCFNRRGSAERPLVTDLRIEGARAVSSEDIEEGLANRQSNKPWLPLFGEPRYLDRDALPTDLKRVERYYRARGYYDARVAGAELIEKGEGRVEVVIGVEEGEPVRVGDVSVSGLEGVAPEVATKVGELPIRAGQVFTEDAYDAGREALLDALRSSGYARAEVEQQALVDEVAREALVAYQVTPGERFRFGNVFVAGTAVVPRKRVREEAQLSVHPGQYFDPEKLQAAQARVFDLGVFGGVRVSQGAPDPQRKTIPVVVAVREAPFRTVRLGPGFGVQASRWDVNFLASWTHRNWFGGLRRLSLDARPGYAWLPGPVDPRKQGIVGLASAELSQPGAIRRILDVGTRVELERGLDDAFTFTSERLRLSTPLRLGRWTFIPSYNLELYQLQDVEGVVTAEEGVPEILAECGGAATQVGAPTDSANCLLSFLEQRVIWDGRDDAVNTRRGFYTSLAVQEGFRIAGAGFPYLRVVPEVRAFWSFGPKLTVAARARVGALVPLGGADAAPIIARFYAGGPNSMRGYYTRRLSPMSETEDGEFVAVGGEQLTDGSLELRFPIAGALGGTLFLDAGDVPSTTSGEGTALRRMATSLVGALDPRDLQYAAGLGLRYRTPFGPLAFDVGVRLPKRSGGRWVIPEVPSGGGAEHTEPLIGAHLSLGEAF